ncbi:hypothetical protein OBG91_14930 [Lactococcus lactis]|nr:hypothetical protein [Lactococcus lactis]
MYDEIRQLDHRANIREEVTSNLNKQYSIEKQNIHTECQDELDKQMQAEKLRHEQAIQKSEVILKTVNLKKSQN